MGDDLAADVHEFDFFVAHGRSADGIAFDGYVEVLACCCVAYACSCILNGDGEGIEDKVGQGSVCHSADEAVLCLVEVEVCDSAVDGILVVDVELFAYQLVGLFVDAWLADEPSVGSGFISYACFAGYVYACPVGLDFDVSLVVVGEVCSETGGFDWQGAELEVVAVDVEGCKKGVAADVDIAELVLGEGSAVEN